MIFLSLLLGLNAYAADLTAEEFRAAFASAQAKIEASLPELSADLNNLNLNELAEAAAIESTDEILVVAAGEGTQESVAVNEPSARRVLINRARWAAVPSALTKEAVALHEILSLAGAESTGAYPYSSRYLAKFGGRSDAAYLISGRDPGAAPWKSRRASCEQRFEYRDLQTGRLHKDSTFGLTAFARWKLRSKTYGLQINFGNEVENVQTVTPFGQTVTETIGRDGNGDIIRIEDRVVIRTINDYLYYEKPTVTYVEEGTAAASKRFFFEKGRRGKQREAGTFEELADGSLRILSDNLVPHVNKNVQTLVSRVECTARQLPRGEWAAITGEPGIAATFETLDRLAAAANAAVLKPGFRGTEASPEEKEFLAAWNELFAAEIRKVRAVRYQPAKGIQGSILAAGRRPAPIPLELKLRALKGMGKAPSLSATKNSAPKPKTAAPKRAKACPIATKPTFIRAPDGGSPILRMEGQSLCLNSAESESLSSLNALKRKQNR